jgi:hypothetical protein
MTETTIADAKTLELVERMRAMMLKYPQRMNIYVYTDTSGEPGYSIAVEPEYGGNDIPDVTLVDLMDRCTVITREYAIEFCGEEPVPQTDPIPVTDITEDPSMLNVQ